MTDFVTTDDLADFLDVDVELLPAGAQLALDAAQWSVRLFLDQEITLVEDDDVLLDGNGRRRLRLPERPVHNVTSVTVEDTLLDPDTYLLRKAVIILTLGSGVFTAGLANVEVVYTHGWSTLGDSSGDILTVPADIILVTLSVARRILFKMGADGDTEDMAGETMGAYSYTRRQTTEFARGASDLLKSEAAVLERRAIRKVV